MADVLIRGMKMPQRCKACRFCGFGGERSELNVCMFTGESQPKLSQERMSKCPLVPVPPHGRLIDAEAYMDYMQNRYDNNEITNGDWIDFRLSLKDQPTIVPAEGGTNKCSEN